MSHVLGSEELSNRMSGQLATYEMKLSELYSSTLIIGPCAFIHTVLTKRDNSTSRCCNNHLKMATLANTENPAKTRENGLPQNYRYITDHDADGKAVFSHKLPELQPWSVIDGTAHFSLNYTTSQYPVSFKDNKDIADYESYLKSSPGLVVPGGSVLRLVDIQPGGVSPMHRTVSIDYGVVLEGEIYLVLDSGETRLMRRGDISIQRGTNHQWRNKSTTEWGRMMYVLLESEPQEIGGKALGEDLGDMTGVKSSG